MSSNSDVIPPIPWEVLLSCTQDGGRISKCHNYVTIWMNGMEYYTVEVTLEDKSTRRIDAFGQDAITLYRNVMKIKQLSLATN
jgi:hypothetical protein